MPASFFKLYYAPVQGLPKQGTMPTLEHPLHFQSGMLMIFQPGDQLLHGSGVVLVGDLVEEFGIAFTDANCAEFIRHGLLKDG